MRKWLVFIVLLGLLWIRTAFAAPTLSVMPETILQGDPMFVTVENALPLKEILFDGKNFPFFIYDGKPRAFIGIDLREKPGDYELSARFADGETLTKIVTVTAREKIEAPLGIPQKLGGDTPASQKNLVDSLTKENQSLSEIRTGKKAFWTAPFRFPVKYPFVTDTYGYNRKTGEYTIPHKGTDFRAEEGTRVRAMNRGVVRIARSYRVYGKTIVVDHGLGLLTFSMHLSKIKVNEGELVLPGQVIGLSGKTGYAEQPHLHVSVRINGTSIDPIKFLDLFAPNSSGQ
ncbi:MAG: M23 family metallopeptidase [Patescibacteria group bacterium]